MELLATVGLGAFYNETILLETNEASLESVTGSIEYLHRGGHISRGSVISASLMGPKLPLALHNLKLFFWKIVGLLIAVIVEEVLTLLLIVISKRIFYLGKEGGLSYWL